MSNEWSRTGGGTHGACLRASGDPEEESSGLPVLNLAVLHELEDELGSVSVAHQFASDYVGSWGKRLTYLERSIEADDPEAAMDALISMKISAFMVGASRLASLTVEAECLLQAGNLPAVRGLLPILAQTGGEAVRELKTEYL